MWKPEYLSSIYEALSTFYTYPIDLGSLQQLNVRRSSGNQGPPSSKVGNIFLDIGAETSHKDYMWTKNARARVWQEAMRCIAGARPLWGDPLAVHGSVLWYMLAEQALVREERLKSASVGTCLSLNREEDNDLSRGARHCTPAEYGWSGAYRLISNWTKGVITHITQYSTAPYKVTSMPSPLYALIRSTL